MGTEEGKQSVVHYVVDRDGRPTIDWGQNVDRDGRPINWDGKPTGVAQRAKATLLKIGFLAA